MGDVLVKFVLLLHTVTNNYSQNIESLVYMQHKNTKKN